MKTEEKTKVKISMELYPDDLRELALKAGKAGLSIAELLENFIADLVSSEHCRNGSDESDIACEWYDRCWFGSFPEETFLRYLLEEHEFDTFIEDTDYLDSLNYELKDVLESGEPEQDVVDEINEEISEYKERIREPYDQYVCEQEKKGRGGKLPDFETAKAAVLKWHEENMRF